METGNSMERQTNAAEDFYEQFSFTLVDNFTVMATRSKPCQWMSSQWRDSMPREAESVLLAILHSPSSIIHLRSARMWRKSSANSAAQTNSASPSTNSYRCCMLLNKQALGTSAGAAFVRLGIKLAGGKSILAGLPVCAIMSV
jgi:hypothetical protein